MHILYATDGSEVAMAAGRLLAGLPLGNSEVTLLAVAHPGDDGPAEAALASARELLRDFTGDLKCELRIGVAAQGILQAADDRQADLVVVGSRGLSDLTRFFVGSVAERVARHARCPVLLVRSGNPGLRRVILGVDGSEHAARAVEWVRDFPLPDGCEVRLLTLLPAFHQIAHERLTLLPPLAEKSMTLDEWQREKATRTLEELAGRLEAAGKGAVTEMRAGDPAMGLVDAAFEEGADLIVVGSHGQGAVERFFLGSVSENVLRHAHCSVLVVKEAARIKQSESETCPAGAPEGLQPVASTA